MEYAAVLVAAEAGALFLAAVVHMLVPYTTLKEILPFPVYPVLLHCSRAASCSRHVAAKA